MYVQVHDNNDVTNTALSRTTGAIALRPFNEHSGWAFMSLASGNQIVRNIWTILPIPNDVVTRVHDIAASQSESPNEINADTPFTWISGEPIIASDVVDEGASEAEIEANNENNEQEMQNAENNENDEQAMQNIEEQIENNNNYNNLDLNQERDGVVTDDECEEEERNESDEMSTENEDKRSAEADFQQLFNSNNDANEEEEASDDEENVNDEDERSDNNDMNAPGEVFDPMVIEDKNDEKTIQKEKLRYNLRKRIKDVREQAFNKKHYNFLNIYRNKTMRYSKRTRTYEDYSQGVCNALVRIQNNEAYDQSALNRDLIGCCMTQMSAKKGIRMFGEKALEAMAKEYAQLDRLTVFTPRKRAELTYEQRKDSLNIIDLIKEKRCGKIKGRTVVDGRGQRSKYEKSDTSSPALTVESFIATLVVDAAEGRDVSVCDVAGAFLKAKQPDFVLLRVTGPAIDAIVRANKEKYQPFITYENGTRVLYLQLLKAMYGTLTAALLWYRMFAEYIMELGFELNAYDLCVGNKMVNGTQFTICWYVDDLKLSHVDSKEVTKMIKLIEDKFGSMNVSRGLKHTYLGINFEIKNGKVEILMREYLQECIDAYGEAINTNAATPANKDLFVVNEKSERLDERRNKLFVHIVQVFYGTIKT